MTRRVAALALVLLVVPLGSCDPAALIDFVADESTDLEESDDRAVQAAGASQDAIDRKREAADHRDRAIQDRSLEEAQAAEEADPDDPRNAAYVAALNSLNDESAVPALSRMVDAYSALHPDMSGEEIRARVYGLYLDALHDLIAAESGFEGRNRLIDEYCFELSAYDAMSEETVDPAVVDEYFVVSADSELCS